MLLNPALTGGLLIGSAAIFLLLANGRIAGISGLAWGAVSTRPVALWRWLFLAGLVIGAVAYHQVSGVPAPASPDESPAMAIVAGLVVGVGVHTGNGCTSGHGVCGLGRLSMRSLVATLTFMASGIGTVFIARHVIGATL